MAKPFKNGLIPTRETHGVIQNVYKVGMYESNKNNTVDFLTNGGEVVSESIYVNNKKDIRLFLVNRKIKICYFTEVLKSIEPVTGEHRKTEYVYSIEIEE